MTSHSYPVPKPLWDALENVLMVKSKELIKDIAKTLRQPEKPLLDAFKAKKHTFHLIDMNDPTDDRFTCDALVCGEAVAHRCRKAVIMGLSRCPDHEFYKQPSFPNKPILQRLSTNTNDIYFKDNLGNVYNVQYELMGRIEDDVLVLFEIDDEDEYA